MRSGSGSTRAPRAHHRPQDKDRDPYARSLAAPSARQRAARTRRVPPPHIHRLVTGSSPRSLRAIHRMLVQPDFNFRTQAPQRRRARQAPRQCSYRRARRLDRLAVGERRTCEEKAAACERFKRKVRARKHRAEIGSERGELRGMGSFRRPRCSRCTLASPAMQCTGVASHTAPATVHCSSVRRRRPALRGEASHLPRGVQARAASPRKHALRCQNAPCARAPAARRIGAALLGQVEIRDHDDEFVHERVF
jgi:hypothetical protein